jgi:hypothetical protein
MVICGVGLYILLNSRPDKEVTKLLEIEEKIIEIQRESLNLLKLNKSFLEEELNFK